LNNAVLDAVVTKISSGTSVAVEVGGNVAASICITASIIISSGAAGVYAISHQGGKFDLIADLIQGSGGITSGTAATTINLTLGRIRTTVNSCLNIQGSGLISGNVGTLETTGPTLNTGAAISGSGGSANGGITIIVGKILSIQQCIYWTAASRCSLTVVSIVTTAASIACIEVASGTGIISVVCQYITQSATSYATRMSGTAGSTITLQNARITTGRVFDLLSTQRINLVSLIVVTTTVIGVISANGIVMCRDCRFNAGVGVSIAVNSGELRMEGSYLRNSGVNSPIVVVSLLRIFLYHSIIVSDVSVPSIAGSGGACNVVAIATAVSTAVISVNIEAETMPPFASLS
jgi:hypothetical protein